MFKWWVDDVVFPEWMFNRVVTMGKQGEVHMDPFIETRIKSMEQKLYELSKDITGLEQDMMYPSVREWVIYSAPGGRMTCECHAPILSVEDGDTTTVVCRKCNKTATPNTAFLRNTLERNSRVIFPMR